MAQRWFKKASVQVAIIVATGTIIVAGMYIWHYRSELNRDNKQLTDNIKKKDERIVQLESEVQRLETLLTPFRTIALERYTGSETEVLQKLANQVRYLEEKLQETMRVAEPPKLLFTAKEIKKVENVYNVILQFKPSKNQPLGAMIFNAKLLGETQAQILDFWPTLAGGSFQTGSDSKKILADGKEASLEYQLIGVGYPTFEIKLSGSATLNIQGNYLLEPFTVVVEQ